MLTNSPHILIVSDFSEIIQGIANLVDSEGEYEAGSSFARWAMLDMSITARIDDFDGDAAIEVQEGDVVVFRATARSPLNASIQTFIAGDWMESILGYSSVRVRPPLSFSGGDV